MQKYGILVKAALNIQNREIHMTVGRGGSGVVTIEADLPNIIKKSVTIKQVSADVNKLILYDSADYAATRTYYLHPDLGYDTYDRDRITPVVCEMQAVQHEDGSSFDAAAIRAAHDKFSGLAYSNLIELTMANDDGLVKPERLEFGQEADIISDGVAYRSILTGRERGKNTKAIPEGTLKAACAQVLGLRSFEDEAFAAAVTAIDACPDNLLRFHFRDGHTEEYRWQDRSRRESWTAEMREMARQRALAGR